MLLSCEIELYLCVSFREEWQWLQALSCLDESLEMDHDVQSGPHRLLQDLRSSIKELMAHINVPGNQVSVRKMIPVDSQLVLVRPPVLCDFL